MSPPITDAPAGSLKRKEAGRPAVGRSKVVQTDKGAEAIGEGHS